MAPPRTGTQSLRAALDILGSLEHTRRKHIRCSVCFGNLCSWLYLICHQTPWLEVHLTKASAGKVRNEKCAFPSSFRVSQAIRRFILARQPGQNTCRILQVFDMINCLGPNNFGTFAAHLKDQMWQTSSRAPGASFTDRDVHMAEETWSRKPWCQYLFRNGTLEAALPILDEYDAQIHLFGTHQPENDRKGAKNLRGGLAYFLTCILFKILCLWIGLAKPSTSMEWCLSCVKDAAMDEPFHLLYQEVMAAFPDS